ncbi:Hypothetical predicted protein, partial [Pelobates cultripes]
IFTEFADYYSQLYKDDSETRFPTTTGIRDYLFTDTNSHSEPNTSRSHYRGRNTRLH